MLPPWAAPLRPVLTLDLRSLALFRVILAATLLCDALARLALVRPFLTDDGVVPRALITTAGDPARLSLHMVSGALGVQLALWLLQAAAAAALLAGWRTRAAAFVCWLLALSVAARAPLVTTSGDVLAAMLLLFALVVPLGARWSLDAVAAVNPAPPGHEHASLGNLALLLTAALAPAIAALSPDGLSLTAAGGALHDMLASPSFAHAPGTWLLRTPAALSALGATAVVLQLFVAAGACAPRVRPLLRRLALVTALILILALALAFDAGILPGACLAAASLLIDRGLWDRLAARARRDAPAGVLRIYHGEAPAARRRALLLRELLALPATEVLPARDSARVDRLLQSHTGPIVLDRDDSAHLGTDAVLLLVRRSPLLFPFSGLLTRLASGPAGRGFLERFANPSGPRAAASRAVRFDAPPALQLAALVLAVIVALAQLASAGQSGALPAALRTPLAALGLDRGIVLPARELPAGWIVASGEREDGREVDALNGRDTAPDYARPEPPPFRWRVYRLHLARDDGAPFRDAYAAALCRGWNAAAAEPATRLRRVRLVVVLQAPGAERTEQRILLRHDCAGGTPDDDE